MKKTLVYHLYMMDNYKENIVYWAHLFCLQKYINNFDLVKITICVDDLKRQDLISAGYEWISALSIEKEIQINVVKNNEMGESNTFGREILDMNSDGMVFFAHSKGVTRIIDGQISESILLWLIGLYYYNFNEIDVIEKRFLDMPLKQDVFYGTLMFGSDNEVYDYAFGKHYSGNFYWVNMPKYRNLRAINKIPPMQVTGRWFAETYPNMVCDFERQGGGLGTKNNVWFDMQYIQAYKMNKTEWLELFSNYGDVEGFNKFIDEIYQKISIENIDFTNKFEWDDKV